MERADKLLARLRRTPFGWGQDDLRRLYLAYGFEVRQGARHLDELLRRQGMMDETL